MQLRQALPLLLLSIAQAERRPLLWHRQPTFSEGVTTKLDATKWSSSSSPQSHIPIRVAVANQIQGTTTTVDPGRKGHKAGETLYASVRTRPKPTPKVRIGGELGEKELVPTSVDGEAEAPYLAHDVLENIGKAFVPTSIWRRLTGQEFDHPKAVDDLVATGLNLAQQHEANDWVTWTTKDRVDDKEAALDAGDIVVHMGRCKKTSGSVDGADDDELYGSNLPVVKSESIIHMSPEEMSNLLLDSSRVKTYNKFSLGRADIRRIEGPTGVTKIVRNITKPPVTSKKVMVTTMLHSRQLENGSYIVVSRAVPPVIDEESSKEEYGKSEILLGVNLLEPCNGDKSSRVTSITHVYSPDLPNLVASRVAVKSAINFVKDLRAVCNDEQTSLVNTG